MTHLHLSWVNAAAGGAGGMLVTVISTWLRRHVRPRPEAHGRLQAFTHPGAVAVAERRSDSLTRGVVRCACTADGRVIYSGAIDDCARFALAYNSELRRISGDQT